MGVFDRMNTSDLDGNDMIRRLVKVLDILVPLVTFVFAVLFVDNQISSRFPDDVEIHIVRILAPNIWWILRYIIEGNIFPFYIKVGGTISKDSGSQISKGKVGKSAGEGEVSKIYYIGVFLFSGMASNLCLFLFANAFFYLRDIWWIWDELALDFYLIIIVDYVIASVVWICAYSFFSKINIRKMLPYLYIVSGFEVFGALGDNGPESPVALGVSNWNLFALSIFCAALFVIGFYYYFKRLGRI